MMEQFWRKKSFKVLQKEWTLKLTQAGFHDAEIEIRDDRVLKQRATNAYRQASELERESKLDYFRYMGFMAHNCVFPTDLDRYVMIRHADGASIQEIVEELHGRGITKHRQTLRFIIRRWETVWGVRHWSRKQMNLK